MMYYINEYHQKTPLKDLKVYVYTICTTCKTECKFKNFGNVLNAFHQYQNAYICKDCRATLNEHPRQYTH